MKWTIKQTWDKLTHSTFVGRVMVVLIVLATLAIAMILSGPKPPGDFDPFAPTPTPLVSNTTGTPGSLFPSSEYKLTNGVVLAVVSVVVIILAGTIFYMIRHNKLNRD